MLHARRRLDSAHLLAFVAILLALVAPAGAALVTAKGIANNAVESRHIKNGRITAVDLAARSVTNKQLGIGAVKAPNLANGSIGTNQVADGSLTGTDLVDGSISALDLAPGTVGASALAAGSIGASLLADGGVGTADLADGAVTSAKLASGAVTGSKLGDLSVTSGKLADGAVTSGKLASGAVEAGAIATGAVTAAKLATGAVDEAAIGAGAVDSIELANGAVEAQHVSAGSVTGAALGTVVGVGVEATVVSVPTDALDSFPTPEETDGVVVPFATELFDTAGIWALGTPGNLVVPTAGLYEVHAWVDWDADNDGYREVQIVANNVIIAQERRATFAGSIGNRSNMNLSALFSANAGHVVNLRISHTAGNALVASRVRLTMHRIGTTA